MYRNQIRLKLAIWAFLCICICGLWVRSYWWSDQVGRNSSPPGPLINWGTLLVLPGPPTGTFYGVVTQGGNFYIVRFLTWDSQTPKTGWSCARFVPTNGSLNDFAMMSFAGFSFNWHGTDSTLGFVSVPIWLLLLACAFPPLRKWIRARRQPVPGHCRRCSYDIRATPDRCPECREARPGTPIPA
jgi:hypothetical protein